MFGFLLGPKNPTKDWQRVSDLRLTFALDCGKLNGVGLGDGLGRLSFLGPAEDRDALRAGDYGYFSLGLSVGCDDEEQTIHCFQVIQKDPCEPQYRPFAGLCHYQGERLDLGQLTEEVLLGRVGPPFWRDEDEDEVVLFYEFSPLEWQVELALDGTLKRIIVTNRPLLADEEQRKAYGVNKPFPGLE